MEVLSKKRKAIRTLFTKTVSKFDEVYQADIDEANALFEVLAKKMEELEALDREIMNEIVVDKSEEHITLEVDKQFEYEKSFAVVKRKLQLVNRQNQQADDGNSMHSSIGLVSKHSSLSPKTNVLKLPKVELMKFGGDPKDWLSFWSIFQTIDKDTFLSSEQKFHYLLQTMIPKSRAYEVVKSFPPTGDNYSKVLEELKNRFGRDGLLVQVYVRELLSLILKNSEVGCNLSLTQFYDKLECQLRALESLGVTTEKCACILLPLVESCLPEDLLRTWQRQVTAYSETTAQSTEDISLEEQTLKQLRKFIRSEVESEERITLAKSDYRAVKEVKAKVKPNISKIDIGLPTASCLVDKIRESPQCIFCNGSHKSINCFKAKEIGLNEKKRIVLDKRVCFSCLRYGHSSKDCKRPIKCSNCFRKHPVIMCSKREETLAEEKRKLAGKPSEAQPSEINDLYNVLQPSQVYLQTLVVKLIHDGTERKVRSLIDTGSMRSYILESTAKEMNLCAQGEETLVHSLFGNVKTERCKHNEFSIVLGSLDRDYKCRFKALDQKTISDKIPSIQDSRVIEELQSTDVYISDLGKSELKIEVLIGADIAGKLLTGKRFQLKSGLMVVETLLGWTIMGRINNCSESSYEKSTQSYPSVGMFCSSCDISSLWKLDSIGINDPSETRKSNEIHEMTLKHFQENVIKNREGRYEVCLPWVEDSSLLSTNYEISRKRLQSSVDKAKNLGYFEKYDEVFKCWQNEGIVEEVSESKVEEIRHFIPHHAVLKEGSTTPVRPVFDASCHEKRKPSLNDCLEKGVNFIEKIPTLLNRFRLGKFGVISDIKQAFLQISIKEKDRLFLAFLWVDDQGQLKVLRHCRVVFGLVSSPFLLGAVINHHLDKSKLKFTEKANAIDLLSQSLYVDNCVVSLNSELEIENFISDANKIMEDGSFILRGWESNSIMTECSTTKVLGLEWNKNTDTLNLSFDTNNELKRVTKREILSVAQKLFDPMGFLSPVTIYPKLLLQKTWKEKINWDEEIVGDIKEDFEKWYTSLYILNQIKIPRWLIGSLEVYSMNLHVFCDASQYAFAAVIFLRIECSNGVSLKLVQGKSRVAPIKRITIPRLELLAAVIGIRLYTSIIDSSEIFKNMTTFFWSDSSTCLAWIKRNENWAIFVKNRVEEIRGISDSSQWKFVPGNLNPADLPSRGCSASKLFHLRWWEGPEWLRQPFESWPSNELNWNEEEINEEKRKTVVSSLNKSDSADWYYNRFSKYNMIIRFIAWILRFASNCKNRKKCAGPLLASEVDSAEIYVLRLVQKEVFSGDNLKSLKNLRYFTDDQDLMRLNTKIVLRDDVPDFCQPMILPAKHPVVVRLIRKFHEDSCHVGVQGLLSILRERFWILGGRRSIKAVVKSCVICRRHLAKKMAAPICPLPTERIRDPVAFEVCGVDLAGPVYLKGELKAYICLFTCAIVRAVHFELILSLSTEAFIQALRRFISRRGRPMTLFSDNGTNFTGTENLLKSLDWQRIQDVQRITWKFSVPCSPWWGGFYERMVRLMKDLLKRTLRRTCLNYEEMMTSLCEVECVINSRPLTYISEDHNDLRPITPSMFIQDLKDSRTPDLDAIEKIKLTKKAVYRQKIREELKLRFRNEYLGQLQHRQRDKSSRAPMVGEVVIIGSDNDKRLSWPIAVITEVIKGKDGIVRTIKLKTSTGELWRPIQRIYPLEVRSNEEEAMMFPKEVNPITQQIEKEEEMLSKEEKRISRTGRMIKIPERYRQED